MQWMLHLSFTIVEQTANGIRNIYYYIIQHSRASEQRTLWERAFVHFSEAVPISEACHCLTIASLNNV